MNPAEFHRLAELVADGLLMITGEGEILACNKQALSALGCKEQPESLRQVAVAAPEQFAATLRLWRRSRQEIAAALRVHGQQQSVRVFGRLLQRDDDPANAVLLVRIPDEDAAARRFSILNHKIDELGREISRRRFLEERLREQYDLAAFGRDIGIILAEDTAIDATLQRCTEAIVKHLDVAFARIWTVSPNGQDLLLRASAGLYTHLDGKHSQIPIGQYKIGRIAETQEPHLTNQVVGDSNVHDQDWAKREGMVAFVGHPLVVDRRTVGVMAVFARQKLSERNTEAMRSIANSVALGIERRKIEAQLTRTARSLKRADRRKDEFLAMLAHELRNPLAPIRTGLELLKLQSGEDETVSVMLENVQHLTRLVDDLLDVSRIMRGRIDLRREPVQLADVADQVVSNMRPMLDNCRHALHVEKCEAPTWIFADPVRISQIIANLLANAAKYTPAGGQIDLEVDRVGDQATIRVRDNGIGVAKEFLPEIFDLFSQSDRSLARSEGGLGIGLTLVQRLVELHDGEIGVHSEGPNQGAEFIVRLPLAEAPDAPAVPQYDAATPIPDCKILIVDDSVGSARILQSLLEAIGAGSTELAHDGPTAISAAVSFRPDVIFLDIGLPEISGYDVARRLRSEEQFRNTRIVAITGYGTEEDRQQSRAAGFDEHLVKPVGLDDLERVLKSLNANQG